MSRRARILYRGVVALPLLLGLLAGAYEFREAARLDERKVFVEGTVTETGTTCTDRVVGLTTETECAPSVTVEFTTPDGRRHTTEAPGTGQTLTVWYDPQNPDARTPQNEPGNRRTKGLTIGIVLAAVSLAFALGFAPLFRHY